MAAATKPINSSKYYLAYSTDGGSTIIKVGELISKNLQRGHSTRETTSTDSAGWEKAGEGKLNWSMSGEFYPVFSAGAGFATENDLHTLYAERTLADWYLTTAETGNHEYTGEGYITQLDLGGGFEDNMACPIAIKGSGVLTGQAVS